MSATENPRFIIDEADAISLVNECGMYLNRLNKKWRSNKKVVLAAIESSFGLAFQYADKELKDDWEVVCAAIKKEPRVLTFASKRLTDNDNVRKFAFELNGSTFIVDKVAMAEFEYQDRLLMNSCTHYIDKGYGEEPEMICDEKIMLASPFYKKFERFYAGVDLTAQEIRDLEDWLLKAKYNRAIKNRTISKPKEVEKETEV